jgi:redox-sensitive bicupin YhaK (pirin superfamily)
MADLDAGKRARYEKHLRDNGVYFFVIEGKVKINGQSIERRDGLGSAVGESFLVRSETDAQLLVIEVPMSGR